jgi:hypothetical protein
VVIDGHNTTQSQLVTGCTVSRFQNGDLDYDGVGYQRNTWPNGRPNTPVSAFYIGPFDPGGNAYPQIQYQTDAAGSERLCNTESGVGCTAPPIGAKFYPFWTLSRRLRVSGMGRVPACFWNFGNVIRGLTAQDFGRTAQYGAPNLARYGGTLISKPRPNPQFSGRCPRLRLQR